MKSGIVVWIPTASFWADVSMDVAETKNAKINAWLNLKNDN